MSFTSMLHGHSTADVSADMAAMKDLLFAPTTHTRSASVFKQPPKASVLFSKPAAYPEEMIPPTLDMFDMTTTTEEELSLFPPEIRSIMSDSPPNTPSTTYTSSPPSSTVDSSILNLFPDDDMDFSLAHQLPLFGLSQRQHQEKLSLSSSQQGSISPDMIFAPAMHIPSVLPPTLSMTRSLSPRIASQESSLSKEVKPTGYRKSVTPLLDADAPIQPRKYIKLKSATARKTLPVSFLKKVEMADFLEDTTDTSSPVITPDILAEIEEKRKQNTLAARKSRARKKGHIDQLESTIELQRQQIEDLRSQLDRALQTLHFSQRLESLDV